MSRFSKIPTGLFTEATNSALRTRSGFSSTFHNRSKYEIPSNFKFGFAKPALSFSVGFLAGASILLASGVASAQEEKKQENDLFDVMDPLSAAESKGDNKWKPSQMPTYVKVVAFGGALAVFIGWNIAVIPFLMTARKKYGGIPFVTTSTKQLDAIFNMLPMNKLQGKHLVDLGSGSGTIITEAAYRGMNATGYEVNPWLIRRTLNKCKEYKMEDQLSVKALNFWDAKLNDADVVTFYGVTKVMKRFEEKMESADVNPGTYVVAIGFELPNWKPQDMEESVYVYLKKDGDSKNNHMNEEEKKHFLEAKKVMQENRPEEEKQEQEYDKDDRHQKDEEEDEKQRLKPNK